MVNVYIKERINDQTTICAGGVTGNTTYLDFSLMTTAGFLPFYPRSRPLALGGVEREKSSFRLLPSYVC